MYITLDFDKLVETIQRIHQRIYERFPCSRLLTIADELGEMAEKSSEDIEWINRPNWYLRASVALVVILSSALVIYSWLHIDLKAGKVTQVSLIQLSESVFNILILAGAGVFFLFSMETRLKRSRLIRSLHHLREIAHVIDMLQLTKDPYYASGTDNAVKTDSSPERSMTVFELQRYLDYCSEMLSIVGKLSALYVKHFPDPVVTSSVNEVELLCTNLSRKIWQKIMIANNIQNVMDAKEQ